MKKRFLTLALVLLVCISSVFMFSGCIDDPNHKSTLTATPIDKPVEFTQYDWNSAKNKSKSNTKKEEEENTERVRGLNTLKFTYKSNQTSGALYKDFNDKTYSELLSEYNKERTDTTKLVFSLSVSFLNISNFSGISL